MASAAHYVFAYGSLVALGDDQGDNRYGDGQAAAAPLHPASAVPAVLHGYRRTWNVAMDNSRSIPGYKRYLDPANGEPAEGFVVFLNIVPDWAGRVNGALIAVSPDQLGNLDRRERNYQRIDATAHLAGLIEATVWAYTGLRAAVERFEAGRRAGRAMISEGYRDGVRQGFAALGDEAAAQFAAWTDPPPCPVVPLQRVSVPAS